jgi:hypothetical protein
MRQRVTIELRVKLFLTKAKVLWKLLGVLHIAFRTAPMEKNLLAALVRVLDPLLNAPQVERLVASGAIPYFRFLMDFHVANRALNLPLLEHLA